VTRQSGAKPEDVAFWVPLFGAVAVACLMPAVADTYWHLRAGQDIVATGTVSLVDRYSYTARGDEWPDHEWLWQLASFGAHALGGMPLLTAFAAGLVVAALAIAHHLAVGPWPTRALLFTLTVPFTRTGWAVRPQAFTLLALVAVLALTARRRLVFVPLIFLVWANVHGAVVLGFIPLVAGLGVALMRREHKWALAIAAAIVASGAATFVTPLGPRLYSFIGESMERSRLNVIGEWRPTIDVLGFYIPYLVIAAALPVAAVRLWRRLPTFEDQVIVGTAVLFAPLAVRALRNNGPLALLAFPAATRLLAVSTSARLAAWSAAVRDALEGIVGSGPEALARSRRQIVGFGLLTAALVGVGWVHPFARSNWVPVSARARAAIAGCSGQVFNEYGKGGYLIWFVPEKPVFIDGRQDPYGISFLSTARELADDPAARAATFQRYQIQCAALDPKSRMVGLLREAGWRERYRDDRWVVLAE
jgi:hypothetical protein